MLSHILVSGKLCGIEEPASFLWLWRVGLLLDALSRDGVCDVAKVLCLCMISPATKKNNNPHFDCWCCAPIWTSVPPANSKITVKKKKYVQKISLRRRGLTFDEWCI